MKEWWSASVTVGALSFMPNDAAPNIMYEQPLSERIRIFLRLEFLFERAEYNLQSSDILASRGALEAINDVMSVVSRTDLKKELITELDRHTGTLAALARNPNVDQERLAQTQEQVHSMLSGLKKLESAPGLELREHELLSAVSDFDLPNYHFWLRSTPEQRHADLRRWLATFSYLRDATELCLHLVRSSAISSQEVAGNGFFQKTLETNTPCQMIRVALASDWDCYPEISAGRHRFTVRFMVPGDPASRATQSTSDVPFHLHCCVI